MLRVIKAGSGLVLGLIVLAANPAARADDDDCGSCGEGDLESLGARVDWTGSDWELSVDYEVELEDVHPRDAFDLVLTPLHCGRELVDASGEAVRLIVPLEFRANCRRDEITFEDVVSARLAEGLIDDPYRLRVAGEVTCRESGKLLDDSTTGVKVCNLPPHFVQRVVVYEEPVYVAPPPPPPVICPPPPPPVVIYRPRPVVIYRPYVPCRPYYECRPRWRRGFVHVDVDW